MRRQLSKLVPALVAAATGTKGTCAQIGMQTMAPALNALLNISSCGSLRSLHSSSVPHAAPTTPYDVNEDEPAPKISDNPLEWEGNRKYRSLSDKELWHEAWMYEDKFGTENDPIVVPSLQDSRIIGVTDPEDDTLVVWGILKANEPPRQFIENGEFYVLKMVPYVAKVGDVLDALAAKGESGGEDASKKPISSA